LPHAVMLEISTNALVAENPAGLKVAKSPLGM
jgi:hypothetical protein